MDTYKMLLTNETYEAALKVLGRQERSRYPNMLKMLVEETQLNVTSAAYKNKIRVKFWFKNILPLLCDDDIVIQNAAVDAFTAFIPHLMVTDYENHEDWPTTKAILVDQYPDKIGEFRNRLNSNWYRIWSVVVNILNKSILRSAKIQPFLTVMEQGFRSGNMEICAEAFLSWQALIETFSRNNVLLDKKRIDLVCTPLLKPSKSKTAAIAVNKFQVWWYLLCTIHTSLADFIETIVQPFLVFCFGPINSKKLFSTTFMSFKEVMPMSVAALISLLGPTCKEADTIMERSKLGRMPQHCEFIVQICKTNHTIIVNSCGEATAFIWNLIDLPIEERRNLCICLWKNLVKHINGLKSLTMYKLMMENINELIKIANMQSFSPNDTAEVLKSLIGTIILEICQHCTIPLHYSDASIEVEQRFAAGQQMIVLMLKSDFCSSYQIQAVINQLYDLSAMERFTGYFNVLRCLTAFLINFSGKSEVRHKIWSAFQSSLYRHMQSQTDNSTDADAAFSFLMIPIIINHETFTTYKDEWSRLAESIAIVFGRKSLCESCIKILRTDCFNVKELSEVVAILITLEEYSFKDVKDVPSAVFDYISVVLETKAATRMKDLDSIATAVSTYVKRLGGVEMFLIYPRLKKIIIDLEATVASICCDQSLIYDIKNNETQMPDDDLKRKLTELRKESNSVFMSLVLKYDPDRLTDSQKDKMKERRSKQPTLYNDMSQSQESHSSTQAWKPKTLFLPHDGANGSMVIEVHSNSTKELVVAKTNEEIASPTASDTAPMPPDNTVSKTDLDAQISLSPASTTSTTSKNSEDQESCREAKEQADLKRLDILFASTEFKDIGKQRTRRSASRKTIRLNQTSPSSVTHKTVSTRSSMRFLMLDSKKPQQCRGAKSNGGDIEPQTKQKTNVKATPSQKVEKTITKDLRIGNGESSAISSIDKATDCNNDSMHALQESSAKKKIHTRSSSLHMHLCDIDSPSTIVQLPKVKDDNINGSSSASSRKIKTKNMAENETSKETKADNIASIVQNIEPSIVPIVKDVEITNAPILKNVELIVKNFKNTITDVEPTIAPTARNVDLTIASIVNTVESEAKISSPDTSIVFEATQQSSMSLISGRRSFNRVPNWKTAAAVGVNIQNMDTLPVNTECLNEVLMNNTEVRTTISPIPDIVVDKSNAAVQKICEMDTVPNTEPIPETVLTTLETESKETNDKTRSPTPPSYNDHPVAVSPLFSKDVNMIDVDKSLIQSIITSPRIGDIDARNAELLNSTITISPIPRKMTLEERKVFDNIIRNITSPLTSAGTLLPVPQNRLHSSLPSASIMNPVSSGGRSPCSSRLNVKLKGRGAQLLNMIKSRKLENLFPNNEHNIIQPASNINAANKDYLTFSKVLPSSMAIPSCSILKRKLFAESSVNGNLESSASKRKRVSFHDPPVSATKQYINHADEHVDRTKIATEQIQALMSRTDDSNLPASQCEMPLKHVLRRKGRADSMVELAMYVPKTTTSLPLELSQLPILPSALISPNHTAGTSVDMESLNRNKNTDNDNINVTHSGSIIFENENAVLENVFAKYPLEELLEKYRATGRQISARFLTKELSHLMLQNKRTCSDTLEHLCENHSKSFLQHAIQENLGSVVCSCLTPTVIFDYILEESKSNANIRTTALDTFSAIAAHSSNPKDETSEWRATLLKLLELAKSEALAGNSQVKTKLTEIFNGTFANDDEITDEIQQFLISLLTNRKINPEQVFQLMSVMVKNGNSAT